MMMESEVQNENTNIKSTDISSSNVDARNVVNHHHQPHPSHHHHHHQCTHLRTKHYLIFDIVDGKRRWNIGWTLFFTVLLPAIVALKIYFTLRVLMQQPSGAFGPVSEHTYKVFKQYDVDSDGYLSPFEFQRAFYEIKAGTISETVNLTEIEKESFHDDVKSILSNQKFDDNVEILNLKTLFKPMDLNTMKKFQDQTFQDPQAMYHMVGLKTWQNPHIEAANLSVANFSILLPRPPTDISKSGTLWDLIPKKLGGILGASHLANYRYLPPQPADEIEKLFLYLLSMIHQRPFLHMRFPPRGSVACLRAFNSDYYDIMFRLHPEFQLNTPPQFPFWFTPASFIGRTIIKKDGSHIEYFQMHLPTRNNLNIDMEWITAEIPDPQNNSSVNDAHGQEVDIGYIEEMRILSTQPSASVYNIKTAAQPVNLDAFQWTDEISEEKAYKLLERDFYPFKQVPYIPFNETFKQAKEEHKLIHHILLWGALDDQSC